MPLMLGLAVGASFGPVNVLLARTALTRGARAAIYFACGALVGDLVLLICSVAAGARLVLFLRTSGFWPTAQIVLGLALASIAVLGLARSTEQRVSVRTGITENRFIFAILITVLNPLGTVMWLTTGSILLGSQRHLASLEVALITLWTFGGDLAWFVAWTLSLILLQRLLSSRHMELLGRLAYLVILIYAGLTLAKGIQALGGQ